MIAAYVGDTDDFIALLDPFVGEVGEVLKLEP
jgi:hypothetical protein